MSCGERENVISSVGLTHILLVVPVPLHARPVVVSSLLQDQSLLMLASLALITLRSMMTMMIVSSTLVTTVLTTRNSLMRLPFVLLVSSAQATTFSGIVLLELIVDLVLQSLRMTVCLVYTVPTPQLVLKRVLTALASVRLEIKTICHVSIVPL